MARRPPRPRRRAPRRWIDGRRRPPLADLRRVRLAYSQGCSRRGNGALEIHKPKPWHGWREFLKEYLIIVVGVLTALAAEQAAESWHWRERAHEARERLRAEVAHQYLVDLEYLAIEPCLDRQL